MIITASILGVSSLVSAATSTGAVLGGIGLGSIGVGAAAKIGASLAAKTAAKTVAKKLAFAAAEQVVCSGICKLMERDRYQYEDEREYDDEEYDEKDYDDEDPSTSFSCSNFARIVAEITAREKNNCNPIIGINQKLTDDQLHSLEELLQESE